MTLQDIKDLKDRIYEIEGLLELAQLREDKIPELEPLIMERIKNLCLNEAEEVEEVKEGEPAEEDMEEPAATQIEYCGEKEQCADIEEAIEEEIEFTEPKLVKEESEEVEEAEEAEEYADEVKSAPSESSTVKPEPNGVITELFEDSETVSVSRNNEELEDVEIEKPAYHHREDKTDDKYPKFGGPSSKPAFTLNDRFRFRRELFGNSDAEYSSAMDLIASMDTYDEAEEYFLDELGWSLDNPEVKDFMDIIQKYFEQ